MAPPTPDLAPPPDALAAPDAATADARSRAGWIARAPAAIQVLRPHQWAKNALVFVAAVGAHRVADPAVVVRSLVAFAAFCLVASALYVVNDLRDVDADRLHPRKRLRPLATGALSPGAARAEAALLLAAGFGAAALLPRAFLAVLGVYAAGSAAYTFALKRLVMADVLALAGLYTLRIWAGGFATGIAITDWLAIFSMFAFLSLALLKRASELVRGGEAPPGRAYRPSDQGAIVALGAGASCVAVLVLALYVASPEVRILYARPAWLWALCPLFLYTLGRMWILARRGLVTEDPVVFILEDPSSWAVGALAFAIMWLGA